MQGWRCWVYSMVLTHAMHAACRLAASLMMHGRNNGKKLMAVRWVTALVTGGLG